MSRFNGYARKADEIAKAAFEEYRKAEAGYKKAEAAAKQYPPRHGMVDAQYAAKSARAQADFLEAKQAYATAQRVFAESGRQFDGLRKELAAEIESAYSVDPAQLDNNTLELLKSGILTGSEYAKLLNAAQAAGNPTMVRLVGKYAQDAADAAAAKYGQSDRAAAELRAIAYQSKTNTGSAHLEAFDYLADVYRRCTNNPGMIDHWDELTAQAVQNF